MPPHPPAPGVVYIHLCGGVIEEVTPATAVEVTADEVVVYDCERCVCRYQRSIVYFCSRDRIAPPVLF